MRKLQGTTGACEDCLAAPRGPGWVEKAHKCRTDAAYARMVYDQIASRSGKKLFLAMFPQYSSWLAHEPTPTGTGPR